MGFFGHGRDHAYKTKPKPMSSSQLWRSLCRDGSSQRECASEAEQQTPAMAEVRAELEALHAVARCQCIRACKTVQRQKSQGVGVDMCGRSDAGFPGGGAVEFQKSWQAAIAQLRVDLLRPHCRDKAKERLAHVHATEARAIMELLWSTSRANFCIEGCRQSSAQPTLPSASCEDRVEELEERLKEHRAVKFKGPKADYTATPRSVQDFSVPQANYSFTASVDQEASTLIRVE